MSGCTNFTKASRTSITQTAPQEYEEAFTIGWSYEFDGPGKANRKRGRGSRDTNLKGAERFAKKHGMDFPEAVQLRVRHRGWDGVEGAVKPMTKCLTKFEHAIVKIWV